MTSVITDPPSRQAFLDPIPRIIPHASLTYVSGASGAGKTSMLAQMMAAMQDGHPFCGHPTNPPTEFCIIAADRDWSTYAEVFKAAGVRHIRRYVLTEDADFDPRAWKRTEAFKFFDRCLNILNPLPGALVVPDPISPLFVQGKVNDSWDVAISSHYFRQQGRKRDITLVCTANTSKQRTEDTYVRPQDRIAGSGSFIAYADTQIYLERDESGQLIFGWVPRRHKAEEFRFQFDESTLLFVPATAPADTPKELDMSESAARIYRLIPTDETGITSPELVRQAAATHNMSRTAIFRALKLLDEKFRLISRSTYGLVTRRKPTANDPPVH